MWTFGPAESRITALSSLTRILPTPGVEDAH